MSTPAPRVGFVGLGEMGSLIAAHLVSWPGGLVVHDTRPEATAALVEAGAEPASSVGDLARRAEVVCVMVVDDAQVLEVFEGSLGEMRPGTVFAVHSTVRPSTAIELDERARRAGVRVLDAPVSGGTIGARSGRLALLVGGENSDIERCMGVFRCYAEVVCNFGPVGAGTRAKLARNIANFVGIAAALEASRLASAAGIDVQKLSIVTTHTDSLSGGPGRVMLRDNRSPLDRDDPLSPVFAHAARLGEKDLALALELAADLGTDLPLSRVAYLRLAEYFGVPREVANDEH